MTVQVQRYNDQLSYTWDDFVASSLNGTFMQERRFLSYHPVGRFTDHSLLFTEKQQLLAVLPAAQVHQNLVSHPGASHGGLIFHDLTTKKCLELLRVLLNYCADTGFDYLRLKPVPRIYHQDLAEQLDFALRYTGFQIEYTELATALELGTATDLRQIMSGTAFRNYQKALHSGLTVVEAADLDDFWPILEHKLKQSHHAKPTHSLAEIQHLQALYPDKIKLFTAYKDSRPTAGVLAFLLNDRVINCFYIAHADQYQHLRPLNLIFAYLIEWGYKHGFCYLDWGISTEAKGSIINTGLFRFKEGFGGRGVLRECYVKKVAP